MARCVCHLNGLEIKDAAARKQIEEANLNIAQLEGRISRHVKETPVYYYVGKSGSDENDGLTGATAFKTMDKFFSMLNEGDSEIRCSIIEAGEYDISYNMFYYASMHISAAVDGVVFNFVEDSWGDGIVFYHCHINFDNITIKAPGETVRFESGVATMTDVTFDCNIVSFYQMYTVCESVTAPTIYLYGSSGMINKLTSTSVSGNAVNLDRGSNIRITGRITLPERAAGNADIVINTHHSVVYCNASAVSGTGWATGIENTSSLVFLPQTTYTKLAAVCGVPTLQDTAYPGVFVNNGYVIGDDYE